MTKVRFVTETPTEQPPRDIVVRLVNEDGSVYVYVGPYIVCVLTPDIGLYRGGNCDSYRIGMPVDDEGRVLLVP